MLNGTEVIAIIRKLPDSEKLGAISGLKVEMASLGQDLSEIFDDLIYTRTRRETYADVAKDLEISYGAVNACVTRARSRYLQDLRDNTSGDPSLCVRCGLSIEGTPDPVEVGSLFAHPECCNRRGHVMKMQLVRPGKKIIAFCNCGWAPQSTFPTGLKAKRAHYIYASVQGQRKEAENGR